MHLNLKLIIFLSIWWKAKKNNVRKIYTFFKKKIRSKFNLKIEENYNISPRQNVWIISENFSILNHKWGFFKRMVQKKNFLFLMLGMKPLKLKMYLKT